MVANVKENVHSCFQNHSIWPYLRADWDTRKLNLKNAFWSSLPLNIEWFHFRICFKSAFASIQCEQALVSIHIKLCRKSKWKSSLMCAISLCESYIRFPKDPFVSDIAFAFAFVQCDHPLTRRPRTQSVLYTYLYCRCSCRHHPASRAHRSARCASVAPRPWSDLYRTAPS